MKSILSVAAMLLAAFGANAQVVGAMNVKFEKQYDQGKFEDCAYNAESMLENDKYKDDPEIMLWCAMCWYEVSQMNDAKKKEEYPKALQDAMKYVAKFRKKDKDGNMFRDNKDFFENLKKAVIAESAPHMDDDKKRRIAVTNYKALNKAIPEDNAVLFMKGVGEHLNKNVGEGDNNIKAAMKGLTTDFSNPKYKIGKVSGPLLQEAMGRYAEHLAKGGMQDSARKTMDWAVKFFPDNEAVKAKAASIGTK